MIIKETQIIGMQRHHFLKIIKIKSKTTLPLVFLSGNMALLVQLIGTGKNSYCVS